MNLSALAQPPRSPGLNHSPAWSATDRQRPKEVAQPASRPLAKSTLPRSIPASIWSSTASAPMEYDFVVAPGADASVSAGRSTAPSPTSTRRQSGSERGQRSGRIQKAGALPDGRDKKVAIEGVFTMAGNRIAPTGQLDHAKRSLSTRCSPTPAIWAEATRTI